MNVPFFIKGNISIVDAKFDNAPPIALFANVKGAYLPISDFLIKNCGTPVAVDNAPMTSPASVLKP